MYRYIKIYIKLLQLSLSSKNAFRMCTLNNFISGFVWATVTLLTTLLVTSKTRSLYGWHPNELLLLTGTYTLMWGVFNVLFSKNFNDIPHILDLGKLDIFLLKPINSQFLLSVNRINYMAFVRIIIGTIILYITSSKMHLMLNSELLGTYSMLLVCGVLIMYASWFIVSTLLIWHDRLSNLLSLMYNITSMANRPTEMYLKISTYIIYMLPIVLIATIPTRYLLHKTTNNEIIMFILLTVIIVSVSIWFWKIALK